MKALPHQRRIVNPGHLDRTRLLVSHLRNASGLRLRRVLEAYSQALDRARRRCRSQASDETRVPLPRPQAVRCPGEATAPARRFQNPHIPGASDSRSRHFRHGSRHMRHPRSRPASSLVRHDLLPGLQQLARQGPPGCLPMASTSSTWFLPCPLLSHRVANPSPVATCRGATETSTVIGDLAHVGCLAERPHLLPPGHPLSKRA